MNNKLLIPLLAGGGAFWLLNRKSTSFATTRPLYPESYDPLYRKNCAGIPLPYLRALTKNESDFNPNEQSGPAWGLMQVVTSVREGYNKRFSKSYTREDLLNPDVNTRIACDLIRKIAGALSRNHPKALPNGADWRDPRFAQLVTFGWNAGYSEAAGVGYMLGQLEGRFLASEITIDKIQEQAPFFPKATRHLSNAGKVSWCKKVVANYFDQMTVG